MKKTEKTWREYDGLISLTIHNITVLSGNDDICFYNFNLSNPEHRYLLRIAMYNRDLQKVHLFVEGTRKQIRKINKFIGKNFSKVRRAKSVTKKNINVPEVLAFMRQDGIARIDDNFRFSDILREYYPDFLEN